MSGPLKCAKVNCPLPAVGFSNYCAMHRDRNIVKTVAGRYAFQDSAKKAKPVKKASKKPVIK
jgi:hypothetical protein